MANNDDNQSNEIPAKTQNFLFGEDLVNYVLSEYSLPGISCSTERQRTFGVRIFNNDLRMVSDFINNMYRLETEQTYNYIMDRDLYTDEWFIRYAETVERKFTCPYPEDVLHYSVHLAHLAAKLCVQGSNTAPDIAVFYIGETRELNESVINMVVQKYIAGPWRSFECDKLLPTEKDEFFTRVYKIAMITPHIHRCKPLIEIADGEKEGKKDERIDKLSSTFSCQSLSDSDSVGVPGSSGGEPTSLYSLESHSDDSSVGKYFQESETQFDCDI